MTEHRSVAVQERPAEAPSRPERLPSTFVSRPTDGEVRAAEPTQPPAVERPAERRRWSDPEEKLALWGVLGFFLLGIYAAVFVSIGMWMTP